MTVWHYKVEPDGRRGFRCRQYMNGQLLKNAWADTEEEGQALCKAWAEVALR